MKKYNLLTLLFFFCALSAHAEEWIRINQLGYLPQSIKVAVFMSEEGTDIQSFQIFDAQTDKFVRTIPMVKSTGKWGNMKSIFRLDFSDLERPGIYYLKAGNAVSPQFPVNAQVYDGTADFLLNYMRQQRCGYNPFLKDSCHVHDGYILYHPTKTGQHIDVRGGWHDATDYLQYTATSANAIYQMMFAYQQNPEAFGDAYDAAGHEGANGIPNTPGQDYERFQGEMVYHDAIGDYSTNEPTMDGTACLIYYLSSMQVEGMKQGKHLNDLSR